MTERFTNHLKGEKSPYLLQHVHNPVDWYPWGEEAFELARSLDKPIFLSIGYATCHWCHVMERESFEDEEIAHEMNDLFVCIKVDREELPQVDSIYMEFAQMIMPNPPGWPLNVILTPRLEPFFAVTYVPPKDLPGIMGMKSLMGRIRELWESEERYRIHNQAHAMVEALSGSKRTSGEEMPFPELLEEGLESIIAISDPIHGGTRGAPKFPMAFHQLYLLQRSLASQDSRALFMVEKTLEGMARGGIYDHIGGGFCRYSVDEGWLVPHFEKMLYDNAQLLELYAKAYVTTDNPEYGQVADEVGKYLLREMQDEKGYFYSAEDSETGNEEGIYYTWKASGIEQYLNEDAEEFMALYNVSEQGNFNSRNILHRKESIDSFAKQRNLPLQELKEKISQQKSVLRKIRETGPRPLKDKKALTAWNGLAIHSFVILGLALQNEDYFQAAERAAEFVLSTLVVDGALKRRYIDGEVKHPATLEDYAFFIRGLLSLFEAGRGTRWLRAALHLNQHLYHYFKAESGAFYQTDGTDDTLLLRNVQFSDGSEPSGNAVQAENLLRIYQLTADQSHFTAAVDVIKASFPYVEGYPPGYPFHLLLLDRFFDDQQPTAIISLVPGDVDKKRILKAFEKRFLPHLAIIWREEDDESLFEAIPYTKAQIPVDGEPTLYLCRRGTCDAPLIGTENILKRISEF